jgi:hypothetical protein
MRACAISRVERAARAYTLSGSRRNEDYIHDGRLACSSESQRECECVCVGKFKLEDREGS